MQSGFQVLKYQDCKVHIDVWDQFRLGGLRSVAEYFVHCMPENQVVFFCSKMAI